MSAEFACIVFITNSYISLRGDIPRFQDARMASNELADGAHVNVYVVVAEHRANEQQCRLIARVHRPMMVNGYVHASTK